MQVNGFWKSVNQCYKCCTIVVRILLILVWFSFDQEMFTPNRRSTFGGDESFDSRKTKSPYQTLNLSVNEEKGSPFNRTYVKK